MLLLVVGGLGGYSELRFNQLRDAVDADVATYQRQRWDRPVLRGATGGGNSALELTRALQGFTALPAEARDHLAAQLYYGQALSAELKPVIDAHAIRVEKLRGSTQMGWAMTELPLDRCAEGAGPPYPLIVDAVLVMLGRAVDSPSDACLAIANDAIRLGQDLVPGATLEAASVAARIASLSAPVIARCAQSAAVDALARSSRELGILATHAPSAGAGIEVADLCARIMLRDMAVLFPERASDPLFTRLRRRPALFEAAALFENPARWRALSPARYPKTRESWLEEQDWRGRSDLPLVASATADVDTWLYDDMRGQATLRALGLGVATLAERARRKKFPREPTGLADPTLVDPFNGQPLKWRFNHDGSELTIWSVGENLRDDKGSSDWTRQAPVDIVVHFRPGPLEPEPTRKTASGARAAK